MTFPAGRATGAWVPAAPMWSPTAATAAIPERLGAAGSAVTGRTANRFQLVSAALFAVILLLSALVGVVLSWPVTTRTPQTAASLRAQALRASENAGWVHVSAPGSVGDVGPGEGSQVIASPDQGNADIVFVGGVAYLRAGATFLVNALALPPAVATDAANRWLSFRPGDPDYQQVADGLTVRSLMAEAIPSGPVRRAGESTMGGVGVVGLVGVQNQLGSIAESQTAWVSATAPHRIVASVARARNNGISVATTVRFSRWGERVSLSAPDGAVPFVSIGGAAATG